MQDKRKAKQANIDIWECPKCGHGALPLAEWMHDEANRAGMNLENKRGNKWRGYGDSCKYKHTEKRSGEVSGEPPAKRVKIE